MRIRILATAGALLCVALAGRPAFATFENIQTDAASRALKAYTTPVVVAPIGGPLTLNNNDFPFGEEHNVVSDAFGPDTQPWCRFFAAGKCPLLWTPATDPGRVNNVRGLENARSNETYTLFCSIYPEIKGTLITI